MIYAKKKYERYAIALIPHVIWDDSDDRIPLMQLYERYKKSVFCRKCVFMYNV